MAIDYRICKPIERFDRDGNKCYLIRCKVIRIGDFIKRTSYKIYIEILDFKTAQPIIVEGITYKKSIDSFYELNEELPFETDCLITKDVLGNIQFVVYYFGARVFVEGLFYPDDMFTEEELLNHFEENYKELNDWLVN